MSVSVCASVHVKRAYTLAERIQYVSLSVASVSFVDGRVYMKHVYILADKAPYVLLVCLGVFVCVCG